MNKPALAADRNDWRVKFLHKVSENEEALTDLFALLDLVWDIYDSADSKKFIVELFALWVRNEKNDLNKRRSDVCELVGHMLQHDQLGDIFELFDLETDFTKVKRGGQNNA